MPLYIYLFRICGVYFCVFFFKQKTAYEMRISDWSSDVCSSDLMADVGAQHAIIPDADVGPDRHIADDPATRRDEGAGVDPRRLAVDADDADVVHSSRPPMIFFQMRTGSVDA